jgi:hypothetical protein
MTKDVHMVWYLLHSEMRQSLGTYRRKEERQEEGREKAGL